MLSFIEEVPRIVTREALREIRDYDDLIEGARERAAQIVEQAEERAIEIEREAEVRGREKGEGDWLEALVRVRVRYGELEDEVREDMLDLSLAIAERLVGSALELDPTHIHGLVEQSLAPLRARRELDIVVHPDDLTEVVKGEDRYHVILENAAIRFSSDPRLQRGDCLITTERGRLDGRLSTRLEALRALLVPDSETP
jgi:flagellar biosynthesis/type III secretory pathway protein FliH